jgi:uncharacterized membrane protein YedE/YeeE
MRTRIAGLALGMIFGATLSWSGMSAPDVIRGALLLEHSYLFLFFASAVATAAVGLAIVRRIGGRALLTGVPLRWAREHVERRHIVGSLVFGIGWGIADACPGPIFTQLGQGIGWAVFTFAGALIGVRLFLARSSRETEPACDPQPAPGGAAGAVAPARG